MKSSENCIMFCRQRMVFGLFRQRSTEGNSQEGSENIAGDVSDDPFEMRLTSQQTLVNDPEEPTGGDPEEGGVVEETEPTSGASTTEGTTDPEGARPPLGRARIISL
jgi:hypothetical protein